MNQREREQMLYLAFMDQTAAHYLEQALTYDKGNVRRWQMARNAILAIYNNKLESLSQDERLKLHKDKLLKEIVIDYKKASDFRLSQSIVSTDFNDLMVLCGYSIEFACRYCKRDKQEQAICPLHEALIGVHAVSGVDLKSKNCPYKHLQPSKCSTPADRLLQEKWETANK